MAISRVQAAVFASAAANNVTASFASPPTAGNLLVAWGRLVAGADGGSIPDWTKAAEALFGASSGYISLLCKKAAAGESQNVTLTKVGATNAEIAIEEWADVDTLDKAASANQSGGVTSKSTGSTAETTEDNELVLAGFAHGSDVTNISYTESFTQEFQKPNGFYTFHGASKIVSSKAAQETTASWSNSRFTGAIIATFKKSASGIIIPVFMNQYKQRWSS